MTEVSFTNAKLVSDAKSRETGKLRSVQSDGLLMPARYRTKKYFRDWKIRQ